MIKEIKRLPKLESINLSYNESISEEKIRALFIAIFK